MPRYAVFPVRKSTHSQPVVGLFFEQQPPCPLFLRKNENAVKQFQIDWRY